MRTYQPNTYSHIARSQVSQFQYNIDFVWMKQQQQKITSAEMFLA